MMAVDGMSYKNELVYKRAHIVPMYHKLIAFNVWFLNEFGEAVMTSAWRPRPIHPEDSGMHSTNPLRAEDLRSFIYTRPDLIAGEINRVWVYDPDRPHLLVCKYHDSGQGEHFHIQTHFNTVRML